MLRVLRESEYLRRASDPKKFLAEAERLGERVAGQPKGARGQRISAWNGFHGRRSLASAGHFTTRHESSRHQHRCSRHDEVAGLHKSEIRELSQRAGLPTWDRPASACLSSRIPYGTEVTPERLSLVERGEAALRNLGFQQFRVRLHDKLARVEISPEEMPRALSSEMAAAISSQLKTAGFTFVALDLEGYRQGALNEVLPGKSSKSAKVSSGT